MIRWKQTYKVTRPITTIDSEGVITRTYDEYEIPEIPDGEDGEPQTPDYGSRKIISSSGDVVCLIASPGAVTIAPQKFDVEANVYPASGRVQAEIYGERLNYMLSMLCDLRYDVRENDGICIDADPEDTSFTPDYRIVAIRKYSDHYLCMLESVTA